MSSSPFESRNVTDDRIATQGSPRNRRTGAGAVKYETTLTGDVVVVEPSFDVDDDGGEHCDDKTASTSPNPSKGDWQARSPSGDEKSPRPEERSSPSKEERTPGGNLSTHFFDATKLSEIPRESSRDGEYYREFKPRPEEEEVSVAGQKHQRGNDSSQPPVAHRRVNSVGRSKVVEKGYSGGYPEQQRRHHREDSAGLDILSAAADCTEEELAAVADARRRPPRAPWDPPSSGPRNSPSAVSSETYYGGNGAMLAPPPPMSRQYPSPSHAYLQPGSGLHPTYHPPPYHPSSFYPPPHHFHRGIPPNSSMGYPIQYSHRIDPYGKHHLPPHLQHSMQPPSGEESGRQPSPAADDRLDTDERVQGSRVSLPPVPPSQWRSAGTTQGVQTFVTAIGVGDGNKMMQPSNMQKNTGTNTENMFTAPHHVPSMVGQPSHHRKMSSYSSLGTILGSAMFAPDPNNDHPLKKHTHHRRASSSASFLHGFEVGLEGSDVAFLHNLQASHNTDLSVVPFCMPTNQQECPPSPDAKSDSQKSESKLAPGGTSKRVRRKCTIKDCPNRVVQGGLCIQHGARRKTCKHPGCNKNVKKAGLCSTHGPARKRCDTDGCSKVAVQGGKCIAHGAKKKLCSYEDCNKQAILAGMCKKHHDQSLGIASNRFGVPAKAEDSAGEDMDTSASRQHSSRHQRGLSIFQEISADTVQDLLAHDGPAVESHRDGGVNTPQRPYNTVYL